MVVSKYMIYVVAVILVVGIVQILLGIFVFLSDALDIYMLVSTFMKEQLCL